MTTTDKKKAHLLGFIQHGVNSHATGMWRHPKDKIGWNYARPDYWQHMARTMERGLFDAMFIADELRHTTTTTAARTRSSNTRCNARPRASTIVPIITAGDQASRCRRHLVDGIRASYSMCRRLSSLDHLSGGRIAWNIVVSYSKSEWDAYGALDDGTARPLRADRRVHGGLLQALGLLGAGRDHRRQGVAGSMPIRPRSTKSITRANITAATGGISSRLAQGRPVLWQAGSSDRGRDFAAKHAEAIFAVHPNGRPDASIHR